MAPTLGTFGAWLNPRHDDDDRLTFAIDAEKLGYGTIWIGVGARPVSDMAFYERVLSETNTVTVASAIINMWSEPAEQIAGAYHRINARHPDRLLLGLGISHPEAMPDFAQPYAKMVDYLDRLDSEGVPHDARVLGALGPKAVRLAGARGLGAHPYLVTPQHTRRAREILGNGPLLAPEHKVVLDDDPVAARAVGRPAVEHPYLGLRNYTNSLRREGFTEHDLSGGGSDRLIDALALHGSVTTIADGLKEHLHAGADHVGIQVLASPGQSPMPGYRALADRLMHP